MNTFYFYKTSEEEWFIYLPEYIKAGGLISDLQLVEGADKMLSLIADNLPFVKLYMDTTSFYGAELLEKISDCDQETTGGAYYKLDIYQTRLVDLKMWLCDVTSYVFGNLPGRIYIKKGE